MNHHFLAFCLAHPWAMEPGRLTAYAGVLARRYLSRDAAASIAAAVAPQAFDSEPAPVAAAPRGASARRGAIAVIPIHGAIVQRASQINICDGGTSTDLIGAALRDAMADDTVSQILLDIDSPGGSVFGLMELANEIRSARATKPIVAHANSLAASAAYWLGCSASEFFVTPSGEVGSIGVYMAHEDWSKAIAASGVDVTLISAGKYKVEANPYGPLDPEAKGFLQERTNDYYGAFTKAVAQGRGVPIESVRSGMGQGRCLGADAALAEKMVDGVMTQSDVIKRMQRAIAQQPMQRSESAGRSRSLAARLAIAGI